MHRFVLEKEKERYKIIALRLCKRIKFVYYYKLLFYFLWLPVTVSLVVLVVFLSFLRWHRWGSILLQWFQYNRLCVVNETTVDLFIIQHLRRPCPQIFPLAHRYFAAISVAMIRCSSRWSGHAQASLTIYS